MLTGWVLLTIGLSAVAGAAAGEFDNEYDLPGSESQEAFDRLEASGFGDRAGATIQLVVEADAGVEDPAVRGAFEAVLAEVASEVSDAEVVSPYGPGGAQQIAESVNVVTFLPHLASCW